MWLYVPSPTGSTSSDLASFGFGDREVSALVGIRFPNCVPARKVGAQGKGLFREVHLATGRTMKEAMA
ncbi:hypothetical protein SAMN02745157_4823 [Kaistia soli DSM 19436]|uniref:Uncharacterized protein n=1 Tax=Kaistia soli DSM 19436 TaxID=1122133 RepID=A0A1M5MNP8_9HYPH|nr:hypothetical protein [Kaistia soli]SHG78393.1 hypothetical protein SAMN02745157_4823 [Kaistia soli DSM 19436]